MIRNIRRFFFFLFASLGVVWLVIACVFLKRNERDKVINDLELLSDTLTKTVAEVKAKKERSIEDEIFNSMAKVRQSMYRAGTNQDLTVECRMCGEVTARGEYYARCDQAYPDEQLPFLFICPDCYDGLEE